MKRGARLRAHARLARATRCCVTGDIVQDDPAGYENFRRLFADFGVPVLCVPGNHDEPLAMRTALGTTSRSCSVDTYDLGAVAHHPAG